MQRSMEAQLREQRDVGQIDGELQTLIERSELVLRTHNSCRTGMALNKEPGFPFSTVMQFVLYMNLTKLSMKRAREHLSRIQLDRSPQELRDKLYPVFCNVRTSLQRLAEAERLEQNFKKAKRFWQRLDQLSSSPMLADSELLFKRVTQLYETLSWRPLPAVVVHSKQIVAAPPMEPRSSSRGALRENVPLVPPHRMAATNSTLLQRRSAGGAAFEPDDNEQDPQRVHSKNKRAAAGPPVLPLCENLPLDRKILGIS